MSLLSVGMIQQACGADPEQNLQRSCDAVREAAGAGARLVVLQELHRTRYFCQQEDGVNFDLAETIPGPTTETLGRLAADLGLVIVSSLFERRGPGIYHNTAAVLETDGAIAGIYRKMHIPDDPGYYEKFYFTPGDLGFNPVTTSVGKLGVLICWDQWFPEAARLMAMAGADLLIYPTAIGWDPRDPADEQQRQHDAWQTVQRAHAVANGLPVITVNRVGHEPDPGGGPGVQFWGGSFAAGPQGEVLWQGEPDKETTGLVEIDLARSEQVRRIWPYLRDRRVDHYGDLLKLYR